MFTQVYFHAVRRAYDLVLTDFISELLEETLGTKQYPEQLTEYLKWNDWRVLAALYESYGREFSELGLEIGSAASSKTSV